MDISVIGCGRWGSFLAWYLDKTGHRVSLYGRQGSSNMEELLKTRKNSLLALPESIELTTDLEKAMTAHTVVVSIDSQGLRKLFEELSEKGLTKNTDFVLCMKGLEIATGKRLSLVAKEFLGEDSRVAVWLGPGHVQEFYATEFALFLIFSLSGNTIVDRIFLFSLTQIVIKYAAVVP